MSRPQFLPNFGAAMATGKHPTAKVRDVMVEDVLYRCNGWDDPWWLDETNSAEYPLGSVVPVLANIAVADSASGTGFAAGAVVSVRVTYYNSSLPNGGKETAPYEESYTMIGNKDLQITITDPATIQAQFNSARYYRKLPGGNYKLHTTKTGSWATPITDTNNDITTNAQMVRRYRTTLPPTFSWMEFHLGFLYGLTGKDSILHYSQERLVSNEGNVTCDFPSGNILPISVNDNYGHTLAIVSEWGQLIVFKERAIYRLLGTSPANLVKRIITGGVGCIAAHSIVRISGVIFFLDERGVYMLSREGEPALVARIKGSNGSPLKPFVDEINRNAAHTIFAHHDKSEGTYECAVPYGDEPTPDKVIVYDYRSDFDRIMSIDDRWFTVAADVVDGSGIRYPLAIDDLGGLFQTNQGSTEGGDATSTSEGIASGDNVAGIVLDASTLGTLNRGCLIKIVDSDGVEIEVNRLHAGVGTAATPLYFTGNSPGATDVMHFGIIPSRIRGPVMLFGDPRWQKDLHTMAVMHKPSAGTLTVGIGLDSLAPTALTFGVSMATVSGHSLVPTPGQTAHRIQWEFRNYAAGAPWGISALDLEYSVRVEDQ